jgi:hypothetical protein
MRAKPSLILSRLFHQRIEFRVNEDLHPPAICRLELDTMCRRQSTKGGKSLP